MERVITGFHSDEVGDWVAELSCGHHQHVRHRPPFQDRPWVVEPMGRKSRIGTAISCPRCDPTPAPARSVAEGGDPACWANQVCPHCGTLLETAPHEHRGS